MHGYKKTFGFKGESLASDYLKKQEYRILKQNFQIWGGEIDIIAQDPETEEIVFVEVKTRSSEFWQYVDETLTYSKKKFIERAAKRFLYENRLEDQNWRVDFIGIIWGTGNAPKILHFKAIELGG